MRRVLSLLGFAVGLGSFVAACQAGTVSGTLDGGPDGGDPGGDATAPDAATTSEASTDASLPPSATTAVYYVACLTQLAFGNADRVISFYGEGTYAPKDTFGGTLGLKLTALAVEGTTPAPPSKVAKSGTTGATHVATAAVDGSGLFSASFGTVVIPGAANPITGRDITIEQTVLTGRFATPKLCTKMAGNVTVPVAVTLDPENNTCLFFEVKDGDPRPPFGAGDFSCN